MIVESAMITDLLINLTANIIHEVGKSELGKYLTESPAKRAIELTEDDFPSLKEISVSLKRWCKSDDFANRIDALHEGQDRRTVEDDLVNSFIDIGKFYDNVSLTNTHQSARRVLQSFLKHLEEELSKTEDWSIIESRRATQRQRALEAMLQGLDERVQQEAEGVKKFIAATVTQLTPLDLETNPLVQEKIHFAAVDFAVELMKEGKAVAARRRLQDLNEKLSKGRWSTDLRFRVVANLASCALQLEDVENALRGYEAALTLKPDHHLVLAYAAQAAMINDETEKALDYARRSRPIGERDPQVTATFIRVLNKARREEEIERLLQEENWIETDADCCFALGLVALEHKQYARAEAYLRNSLGGSVENPHVSRLIAQCIILPIDEVILKDPPVRLEEGIVARLKEAEGRLTEAVEIFEGYDPSSRLYEALLQRAYVRGVIGNTSGALGDCERLLDSYPQDSKVLRQKGHILLSAGRIKEAQQSFMSVEDESERDAARLGLALSFHHAGQHDQVIALLAERWDAYEQTRQQTILADLLIVAYHNEGHGGKIKELIERLENTSPADPEVLAVIARQRLREGRNIDGFEYYKKALGCAVPGNQYDNISFELADCCFEHERWAEAAQHYNGIVDDSSDNSSVRRYLLSLYNAGNRRAALHVAQKLRNDGPAIVFVSEVEARVLAAQDKFEDALSLFRQLILIEPEKLSHRLWIVRMLLRLSKDEEARSTLNAITIDLLNNDADTLIQVAKLRQNLGMGGDLPFLYRARQANFNKSEVHQAYVVLFREHTLRESGDLDVNSVTVDSAVHVVSPQGERHVYVITDEPEPDVKIGEISATDERAVKLIGLQAGDRVLFNEGKADEVEYKIAEIQSKYVYAFQQTIARFTEWFGGTAGMVVMNVADGDVSRVFRFLDQKQEQGKKVSGMYNEGHLTLATLAQVRGRNLFEVWAGIISSSDSRLFAEVGNAAGLTISAKTLAATEDVVIEMSTLLTLSYLDLLELMPRTFRTLFVARPVLDNLNESIEALKHQAPYMTMWKERDQYFRTDITEEMIAHQRGFLEKIKSFLEKHAVVVPPVKALDVPDDELEEYNEVLGRGGTASLFVASEKRLPLLLDDMGLKQVAADPRWDVRGVSTQFVLMRMRSRGLLSAVKYYSALKKLILAKYVFISVDFAALWWMCGDEGLKLTAAMQRILRNTLGPECVAEAALRIAGEFIHRTWLEVRDKTEKLRLIDNVIAVVLNGRDSTFTRAHFKELLTMAFTFLPTALPEILQRIDAYPSEPISDNLREG